MIRSWQMLTRALSGQMLIHIVFANEPFIWCYIFFGVTFVPCISFQVPSRAEAYAATGIVPCSSSVREVLDN
jgi:hypothetical protein